MSGDRRLEHKNQKNKGGTRRLYFSGFLICPSYLLYLNSDEIVMSFHQKE